MTEHAYHFPEDRKPVAEELTLVQWLLENGTSDAAAYLAQIRSLHVVSRCGCGCASIDFATPSDSPMDILSDYQWKTAEGHLCGVFVFARDQRLAGLEVWSIDGLSNADHLPSISDLKPINFS